MALHIAPPYRPAHVECECNNTKFGGLKRKKWMSFICYDFLVMSKLCLQTLLGNLHGRRLSSNVEAVSSNYIRQSPREATF